VRLELPELATQMLPGASIAMDMAALIVPVPPKGEPLTALPESVNAETVALPWFAIHAYPVESIAMADGAFNPLLVKGEFVTGAPVCPRTVSVLLPELAIQMLPVASMVVVFGRLSPGVA